MAQSALMVDNPRKDRMSLGRILVVDDEPQIRRMMRTILIAEGFEVTDARSGGEALEKLRSAKYDVILLDINMAGITGTETCRAIRAGSDVPIIMLTVRKTEKDKTEAFEAGADDYVTKPFSTPELLARIRARLRRKSRSPGFQGTHLRLGEIEIDFETRQVKGGKDEERLTPKEFELLSYMAAHPNKIVTHRELLQEVWSSDAGDQKEYLRVFINRLRNKIEREPDEPQYLLTEPWVGYRLKLPD
ncbi:MAG: response regulator transcription factor [Candidatus Acidiferrales bacterium]|jgi:two-component system KDP operon response regulator KdpE